MLELLFAGGAIANRAFSLQIHQEHCIKDTGADDIEVTLVRFRLDSCDL